MANYRTALPQLGGKFFLTEGGLETTLIFLDGQELPDFAAFYLLRSAAGEALLRKYFHRYAEVARAAAAGLILETPTWRANPDWGAKLGYNASALADVNRRSVQLLEEVRQQYDSGQTPVVISGCIGPRGDGYIPDMAMSAAQASAYHQAQLACFAETTVDLVTALTMNYCAEAIGIARAAQALALPVVLSFTLETDGKLPTGQPLADAIAQADDATGGYPAYYMINCAHPSHFDHSIAAGESWTTRIRGLRANASKMSHAELNDASELDAGDPVALGQDYLALWQGKLRQLNVMGGCCGTDHRHIEQIALACQPAFLRR